MTSSTAATAAAVKPKPASAKGSAKASGGWRLRLRQILAVATVAFLVLPPLQCLLLRWLDPPVTLTMLSRVAG